MLIDIVDPLNLGKINHFGLSMITLTEEEEIDVP